MDDCKERVSNTLKKALVPAVMTTEELFDGRSYVIPEYQRDYVWNEEKDIKPFIQAIALDAEEDVFMGTMLFRKTGDGRFEVLDGRQRLTTLSVLLHLCKSRCGSSENVICGSVFNGAEKLFDDQAKEKINRVFEDVRNEADAEDFEKKFSRHLLKNVCFVVVDSTLETGKTFEIFKTINMTGVPLAAEDIVKVIYAEHIACSCKGDSYDEKLTAAVKKVNALYQKIKGGYLKPIDVLHVLQACLVADKRGTFDEFAQNRVDFFAEECKTKSDLLSFEAVELLFDVCGYVADRLYGRGTSKVGEPEQYFRGLLEWTRYNHFWVLPYMDVFFRLYNRGAGFDESGAEEALKEAAKDTFEVFRIFAVYTVIKQKRVSAVNTFVCNTIFPMLREGYAGNELAEKIDEKLDREKLREFNGYLCGGQDEGLYSNYKRAALICVVSELIAMTEAKESDEHIRSALFSWGNKTSLADAKGKKYNGKYNCDHILARKLFKDTNLKSEFCNGIGNLVLLSDSDNKSAGDALPEEKAKNHYGKQGVFTEAKTIAKTITEEGWGAAQIADRQNDRANRIWEFLRLGNTGIEPEIILPKDVVLDNGDAEIDE